MPIKVRCNECKKVLNAPDAARGKAIRCPQCQTRVPVPGGRKKQARAKKSKVSHAESEDDFASLDLSDVEDSSVRICPKCGEEVADDATECDQCGINLETGAMGKTALRLKGRKGPDPAQFFRTAFKDAWRFSMKNKRLMIRTAIYAVIFETVCVCCAFMILWCHRTPPKVFWGMMTLFTGVVVPGWLWHLNKDILRGTLDRKERLTRVNFDVFTSMALGIGILAWMLAFLVQWVFPIVGIAMLAHDPSGNVIVPAVLIGGGVLMTLLIFPLAMPHMIMPITIRGWLINYMGKSLVKNFAPALLWFAYLVVTSLPLLACCGAIGAVSGNDLGRFVGTVVANAQRAAEAAEAASEADPAAEAAAGPAKVEATPLPWKTMIVPAILFAVACILSGFVAVFNFRTNGLLMYYFKNDLDLVTLKKERKYVSKAELREKREEQKRLAREAKAERKRRKLAEKERAKKRRR